MKYTLRQLEIFLAIAKEQNITRAAQNLHMSQSAASAALQDLEQRYDAGLFDRKGKRLVLSKIGETLRDKAEALLAHALEFEADLQGHADVGHLSVGASLTIGNYLAVEFLAHYMSAHPEADVSFHVGSTPDVVAKVLNFELDVGMIEGEMQHADLQFIPWREDKLRVFCCPKHPLAGKKTLSDEDLLAAKWILREPDSGARHSFERLMQGLLPQLDIFLELEHNEAIKKAVESGMGLGCLSEIVLEAAFKHGDLIPLDLPDRDTARTFYFVLRKGHHPSQAVKSWIALCG
ncbi:MAG: LysR substrate-binding domain-containing protein [Pseudomonadales bacterium]